VRWIDRMGNVHRQDLKAVISETAMTVTVKTTADKVVTIPLWRILTLVREDERRADERALLRAREDVAAGLRLDQARPVLDRLAASGAEPWIKEYAAAARAVLAERASEKDARQRIDRFLKEHGDSRFAGEVYVAATRLRAAVAGKEDRIDIEFAKAFDWIEERKGPLLVRFGAVVEAIRLSLAVDANNIDVHKDFAAGILFEKTKDETDMAMHLVAKSCNAWIRLSLFVDSARKVTALGRQPHGALVGVQRLCNLSAHLLPETRSDLHRELGLLKLACGDPAGARKELEKARKLAPGRVRREAADAALARLK
jgi:hypothetical protein